MVARIASFSPGASQAGHSVTWRCWRSWNGWGVAMRRLRTASERRSRLGRRRPTRHPREVIEMALAHTISDKVEAAYLRGDIFEKRRRVMNEWAKFCAAPMAERGTVVALRQQQ